MIAVSANNLMDRRVRFKDGDMENEYEGIVVAVWHPPLNAVFVFLIMTDDGCLRTANHKHCIVLAKESE